MLDDVEHGGSNTLGESGARPRNAGTGPNKGLHLTAFSVRSCVAPASGSR